MRKTAAKKKPEVAPAPKKYAKQAPPKYLVADVSRCMTLQHPFHPYIAFYMGMGPEVPKDTFVALGRDFKVFDTFPADHPLNPFGITVVMAAKTGY